MGQVKLSHYWVLMAAILAAPHLPPWLTWAWVGLALLYSLIEFGRESR